MQQTTCCLCGSNTHKTTECPWRNLGLVLTRRPGESILIGKDIVVSIGHVNEFGQVRVKIDAPKHVDIVRSELMGKQRKDKEMEK